MCAAVFELYFEDTHGSCASDGFAFPRVRYIQQEMAAVTKVPDTTTEMEPTETPTVTKTTDTSTTMKTTESETVTLDTSTTAESTATENTPWWWHTSETQPGGSSKPTPWWEKSPTTGETHSQSESPTTEVTYSHSESLTTEVTHSHSEIFTTEGTHSHSGSSTTEETHGHSGGSSKLTPWWDVTTREIKTTSSKSGMTTMTATSEEHVTTEIETEPTTAEKHLPLNMTQLKLNSQLQRHLLLNKTQLNLNPQLLHHLPVLCFVQQHQLTSGISCNLAFVLGLVYSAITYDIEIEKFDLKNDDIGKLQKLRKGSVPFIATEEFLTTNNLDGIAFSATHQDAINVEPFAAEFWNRSMKFKRQPLVIIILEFVKIRDSQALAYALTGKCQFLILRKQDPRPPSSTCTPRFPNRPLETNEEMEMKYLELRSRNMTSVCLSFTLAVLNFHGVKNQGRGKVCEKELWVGI
ncbi:hypothetical protein MRX96_007859 [Rhipicephalus microplus]